MTAHSSSADPTAAIPRNWRNAVATATVCVTGNSLLRKSLLSLSDQAVVSATNFAITIILGRLCGKPEVGLYYLALQIVFFARGIQEQLIGAPYLIYAGRRRGKAAASFVGSILFHDLCLLVALSLTLLAASQLGFISTALHELFLLLALAAPLMLLRETIRQISFAELRVTEAFAFDSFVCALQLGGLMLAAWLGVLSVSLTYVVLASGCGVAAVLWLVRRRGSFVVHLNSILPDWRHNWRFSQWALASQLLGSSMPYIIPWIVAATHGESATGTLGVGTTLIGFANMFVLGLSNFICPRAARAFAHGGSAELTGVLKQAAAMYLTILLPFALAMLLMGQQFMSFVYGPEFADAGLIMGVLACGAVANSLGVTSGNGLWAMELPSANFRADVCALIVWIIGTALLVGPCGALGAAVASAAGTIVGAAVRGYVLLAELKRRRVAHV